MSIKSAALKLGVNIDHVATLRQARYRLTPDAANEEPCLLRAARACEAAGADAITIHLREDRRHIQDRDVELLRENLTVKLNLEMGNTGEILQIALRVKPDYVCLVPENRLEITTEGGLDAAGQSASLQNTIRQLQDAGIRVSLFIDPDPRQVDAATALEAEMIELHTGAFANGAREGCPQELLRLIAAAEQGHAAGLQINAGHGINRHNLKRLLETPHVTELNVGHHLVSESLFAGLEATVRDFLQRMKAR